MKRLAKEVNVDNKPVVHFVPPAKFFNYAGNSKYPVARVFTLNHYNLGTQDVRTSIIKKKFKSGAFETLNTFYKPITFQPDTFNNNETVPTKPIVAQESVSEAHSMHAVW
jgi:hypothetical protein